MSKHQPSVLVVEDDSWFAEQQLRTLRGAGFDARHASDGLRGMEEIDEALPDVVILDIFLPGPNALVLLHEIQSHADLRELPIIVCSNSVADVPLEKLKDYGVVGMLDKGSMTPADLIAAVKRVLI